MVLRVVTTTVQAGKMTPWTRATTGRVLFCRYGWQCLLMKWGGEDRQQASQRPRGGTVTGVDWGGKGQVQCQQKAEMPGHGQAHRGGRLGSPEHQEAGRRRGVESGEWEAGRGYTGGDGAPSLTGLSRTVSQGTLEVQGAVPRSHRDWGCYCHFGGRDQEYLLFCHQ